MKVGDEVRVLKNSGGNHYQIGFETKICSGKEDSWLLGKNEYGQDWFVGDHEIELIKGENYVG